MRHIDFYDVSIVMPFYKRIDAFKKALQINSPYFYKNGIEVIVCVDDPLDEVVIQDILFDYPLINWKIVLNQKPHSWRNPAKAINVGIRNAVYKYVLITDPELEFVTDIIHEYRFHLESYRFHYAFGQVIFSDHETSIDVNNYEILPLQRLSYGSLMAPKEFFFSVNGYNETYEVWGGEDDNIRKRFDLMGYEPVYCPNARLIHRENFSERKFTRDQQRAAIPADLLCDMLLPPRAVLDHTDWGKDFDTILYSWQKPSLIKHKQCKSYLQNFMSFHIKPEASFMKEYRLIVLIQTYNEEHRIEKCIRSVEPYCDGIILLDDGSEDHTFEIAQSDKLLIKAKRKRSGFNDLTNRNLLLDLVSFFVCEWTLFIDADECMDSHFYDLNEYLDDPRIDNLGVWIVNLWDSESTYITNFKWFSDFSVDGLWLRWRMFRNKGRMQILSKNKFHFSPLPYRSNAQMTGTLFFHSGFLNKEDRHKKALFYKKEDSQHPDFYQEKHFEEYELKNTDTLTTNVIANAIYKMEKIKAPGQLTFKN